jgi:signal transduction histidine kinase
VTAADGHLAGAMEGSDEVPDRPPPAAAAHRVVARRAWVQRRLHIRNKVAAGLMPPLLALFAIVALKVADVRRAAESVTAESSMAISVVGPDTLITALQVERNVVAFDLVGLDAAIVGTPGLDPEGAMATTDERLEGFVQLVHDRGERVEAVYAPALASLETLDEVRAEAQGFMGPRGFANTEFSKQVFGRYTTVVEEIVEANTRLALTLDDVDLRSGADLIELSNRQEDLTARIVAEVLFATFGHGRLERRADVISVSALLSVMRANEPSLRANARGDYAKSTESYLTSDHIVRFPQLVEEAIATGRPVLIDPVGGNGILDNANVQADDLVGGHTHTSFQKDVEQRLQRRADNLKDEARRTQVLFLGFGSFGLLGVASITFLVSRSITRPLRSLTNQASTMANERLPDAVQDILDTPLGEDVTVPDVDPIRVKTRDEVADIAEALNTVQSSALDLAVEQAVLRRNIADSFVNLGRRNQNLLGRQLDFVTELERDETDPTTLANLFRLDHLGTRMRRNAESLLVLAGIDPPRTWAAPVRLTDVIRAAVGEVEEYPRVVIRAVEPATIIGSAAADLAHLLAELIENALTYSPPDRTVRVVGRYQPGAYARHRGDSAGGYELTIIDSGMGMTHEEFFQANRRLAGAESFTVAPSKYLGHYVAGNLAARHNITIELHNVPDGGIAANVHLPPDLLASETQGDSGDITGSRPGIRQFRSPAPLPAPTGQAALTPTSRPGSAAFQGGLAGEN